MSNKNTREMKGVLRWKRIFCGVVFWSELHVWLVFVYFLQNWKHNYGRYFPPMMFNGHYGHLDWRHNETEQLFKFFICAQQKIVFRIQTHTEQFSRREQYTIYKLLISIADLLFDWVCKQNLLNKYIERNLNYDLFNFLKIFA